jgi:hypothetical protein
MNGGRTLTRCVFIEQFYLTVEAKNQPPHAAILNFRCSGRFGFLIQFLNQLDSKYFAAPGINEYALF